MNLADLDYYQNMTVADQIKESRDWNRAVATEAHLQLRSDIFRQDVERMKAQLNPQSKWRVLWSAIKGVFK